MRPWRDIISTAAWEQVVQKTDSTAHIGRVQSLKAVFDATVDTPKRTLRRLTAMIRQYHSIPKDVYKKLGARIGMLAEIRQVAEQYMFKFEVDSEKAKARVLVTNRVVEPLERNTFTGHYNRGNAADQSLDRNVLSLVNRSFRKAEYLGKLRDYYAAQSQDPNDLVNALKAPQDRGNDSTGLTPGVRMETIDPWHRPFEIEFDSSGKLIECEETYEEFGINTAFCHWYYTIANHNTPFFLWLEKHPICTADDKHMVWTTTSVLYLDNAQAYAVAGAAYKLAMVYAHGGKLWMEELRPDGYTRTADTTGYTCNGGKGVSDAAAFIWTGREIIIAQHREGGFHHSSFINGNVVRCAGMIKMAHGKVTYVSNNSGHYRPGKYLLSQFVSDLNYRGLLDPQCRVQCQGVEPTYCNAATHFVANWQSL
jgi:hypothetical protein